MPRPKESVYACIKKAGINTFFNDLTIEVQFIVATNPGVKLEYGKDGDHKSFNNPASKTETYHCSVLDRVHMTIGNKDLYSDHEYGEDFFTNSTDGQHIYFGSITWQ